MTTDIQFLTEMFDIKSAKGFDYEVTDMKTVTIPEIRFQATFTTDTGIEYAFRVYRADSMPGRKYGQHARLLTFMRRKSRNFSQSITVDKGTFKKVIVTFMRCYEEYKESRDGKKSSSYAVVMQDTLRPYASLFVRATRRAYKNNRRIYLDFVGVNEEGKGGTLELMYVNKISPFHAFGGKDYDVAKFVGNPTHIKLAKFAGKKIDGTDLDAADDVVLNPTARGTTVAQAINSPTNATQATQVNTPTQAVDTSPVADAPLAVVEPEPLIKGVGDKRFNPDEIVGLNDPDNFDLEFIEDAFLAEGRDELEAVFRHYKIHRRFFAHNIDHAFELFTEFYLSVGYRFQTLNVKALTEGAGFYIKRNPSMYKQYLAMIAFNHRIMSVDDMQYLITEGLDTLHVPFIPDESRTFGKLVDAFMSSNFSKTNGSYTAPTYASISSQYDKLIKMCQIFNKPIALYFNYGALRANVDNTLSYIIAAVVMNVVDGKTFTIEALRANMLSMKKPEPIDLMSDANYIEFNNELSRLGVKSNLLIKDRAIPTNSDMFSDFHKVLSDGAKRYTSSALLEYITTTVRPLRTEKEFGQYLSSSNLLSTDVATQLFDYAYSRSDTGSDVYTAIDNVFLSYLNAQNTELRAYISDSNYSTMISRSRLLPMMFKYSIQTSDELVGIVSFLSGHYTTSKREISSEIINWGREAGLIDGNTFTELYFIMLKDGEKNNFAHNTFAYQLTSSMRNSVVSSITYEQMVKMYEASLDGISRESRAERIFLGMIGLCKNSTAVAKFFEYLKTNHSTKDVSTMLTPMARDPHDNVHSLVEVFKTVDLSTMGEDVDLITGALSRLILTKDMQVLESGLSESHLGHVLNNSSRALEYADGEISEDISERVVKSFISSIRRSPVSQVAKSSYYVNSGDVTPNERLLTLMSKMNKSMFDKMDADTFADVKDMIANIRATSTTKRTIYQPMLDNIGDIIAEMDRSKHSDKVNDVLNACEEREKRLLLKSVGKNIYLNRYINELKVNAAIKIETNLDQTGMRKILQFNSISMAKMPNITEKDEFSKVKDKVNKVKLAIPEEQVTPIELTRDELDDLTIEYDAFNRKKHHLSIIIDSAFNVSVPSQVAGRAAWDAKMEAEGIDSTIMSPVFHGTGTVPAAMILRLGFAVASANATAKSGVTVVGRMLGDGIYFSTAIDKVAQYSSDYGYSRQLYETGYIFEMSASLGKHRRDFREAGTSSRYSERTLVSPEWAVFSPNEQLLINKAYKITCVPHKVLDKLKEKRSLVNESKNVTGVRGFRQVIRESLDIKDTAMITFIFGDYRIPVGDGKMVDLLEYDGELGEQVQVESGPFGAIVSIPDTIGMARSDDKIDMYHIALTGAFIEDKLDTLRNQYFELINNSKPL